MVLYNRERYGGSKFEFGRGPEIYQLTCDNCGRKFLVKGDSMPTNWKNQNFVSITCINCKFENRYQVLDLTPLAYHSK